MVDLRHAAGDPHNFGRRVAVGAERVHKPRPLLWEWLVLSGASPLRRLIDDAAEGDGLGREAFSFLLDLSFHPSERDVGGEVERVVLDPLTALASDELDRLATIVGRSIALWSWLGVSDLHWENLVLGRAGDGRIVLSPLDVEMILADLSLPTETKLLPDADPEYAVTCQHACGARRALPYLGKPMGAACLVQVAAAYRDTLVFLDRHTRAISGVVAALPALSRTPIRVCLRGTDEYVQARQNPNELWPPLLDEELVQLERGDIPYFFRLYGRPGIHYYAEPSLDEVKTLPLEGDVPTLDPLLLVSRDLRSPSRKKLREEGLFTVLGAFDHPGLSGRHTAGDLEVTFGPRNLIVKHADRGRGREGGEMRARRDMSEYVSSVYQPCACGEVLAVFVPPVTKCTAAR